MENRNHRHGGDLELNATDSEKAFDQYHRLGASVIFLGKQQLETNRQSFC
jgi:hypothetical protein